MSLLCCCESGNKFNFISQNKFHHVQEEEHEEDVDETAQGEIYDTNSDIFPIYSFAEIKQDLNNFENKSVLTHKVITSGLSDLKTNLNSKNRHCVLSKLVLRNKNLRDVKILQKYNHLSWIDMTCNNIAHLEFLEHIPRIEHLALGHNCIGTLTVYRHGLFHLKVLDLSFNRISHMPSEYSQQFHFLTHLNLANNFITRVDGLNFTNLKYLRTLDLSFNRLKKLENFSNLNIRELYVQNNEINEYVSGYNGLSSNRNLIIIDISHNYLSTLELFSFAFSLLKINAASNKIENLTEILHLQYLHKLRELNLTNNPVSRWCLYEHYVRSVVTYLVKLDNKIFSDVEYSYHFNPKRYFWDQFIEAHGRNIIAFIDLLLRKNTLCRGLVSKKGENILIILVGAPGSYMEDLCQEMACEFSNIHVLKKITTNVSKNMNYINVTHQKFQALVKRGHFIALVEQYGSVYGYSREEIRKCFQEHNICLTDMDLKAALSLRAFGLEPYLILVTVSSDEAHKNILLKKFDILSRDGNIAELIEKNNRQGPIGLCNSNLLILYSEHEDHSDLSNSGSKMNSNIRGSDIPVHSRYPYFPQDVGALKTAFTESSVPECPSDLKEAEEVISFCDEETEESIHAEISNAKSEHAGLSWITNKKEVSPNKGILQNAREIFFKDVFRTSEFYEEMFNEHRELFYSSVKLRDFSDGKHKLSILFKSILEKHGQ